MVVTLTAQTHSALTSKVTANVGHV